jgi:hypothetical protein
MKTEPFRPITRERASEILEISLGTLDALVRDGNLPPPCRIGSSRKLYWDPDVFYAHLRGLLGHSDPGNTFPAPADVPESTEQSVEYRTPVKPAKGSISQRAQLRHQARIALLNR